jgi:hypothetical protein
VVAIPDFLPKGIAHQALHHGAFPVCALQQAPKRGQEKGEAIDRKLSKIKEAVALFPLGRETNN